MPDVSIASIGAREVLDCRGLPTVQVDVVVGDGVLGRADVPAGRSTGSHEAHELRDGGTRFGGFGVRQAVANVNDRIAPALVGRPAAPQRELDAALLELDGTDDKSGLGANAILGVSLAAARAAAAAHGLPLYRYVNVNAHLLPAPQVNLINGGRHASNDLDFQEFIVIPSGAESMLHALQIATEINLQLGEILLQPVRQGRPQHRATRAGMRRRSPTPARHSATCTRRSAGPGTTTSSPTASTARRPTSTTAQPRPTRWPGTRYDRAGMIELYLDLIERYGIVTIEDPLHEDDFEGFAELTQASGIQIVGDDLFVTNPERLRRGIDAGSANALLWKVNQIGTLSEALDAAEMAFRSGYSVVVSERSGETEDPIIADLVVALNAGQIKTGAPVRGERTAKYNRLLLIAEELGATGRYPTKTAAAAQTAG